MSDQNTKIENDLMWIADEVGKRTATVHDADLSDTLHYIGEWHSPREEGDCRTCGMGDTSWPCGDYLIGLRLGTSWLLTRLEALERAADGA